MIMEQGKQSIQLYSVLQETIGAVSGATENLQTCQKLLDMSPIQPAISKRDEFLTTGYSV